MSAVHSEWRARREVRAMFWWDTLIESQLTVSKFVAPEDQAEVSKVRVTCFLSLQTDEDLPFESSQQMARAWREAGIHHHRCPIQDYAPQPLGDALPSAVEKLRELIEAGHHVLVHCTAAINRSPTVAAAYLMRYHEYSKQEALARLRRERFDCIPYEELLEDRPA